MMLCAKGLSVRYKDVDALRNVNLDLSQGQWLMVVGPNGAGKSTLLGALAQTVRSTGDITLLGQDARKMRARDFARQAAVLSQRHMVSYAFNVEELVRLGRYAHQGAFSQGDPLGEEKVEHALNLCGLTDIRRQNALTLSGGELQRAFLAQVFAQDAPLLMLDEPANHLDLRYQQEMFDIISRWLQVPGRAVVSVVHDLTQARRFGTHAMLLSHGRCIARGEKDQVLSPEQLNDVYGMDVRAWISELFLPWSDCGQTAAGSL